MNAFTKIAAAILAVVTVSVISTAWAQPPGHYSGYVYPNGWSYQQYAHPSRFNPWANYAVPGTQSQYYYSVPGYGYVTGTQWIGWDGRPHGNTYSVNPWGSSMTMRRAVVSTNGTPAGTYRIVRPTTVPVR
jgi:hypothetical protein